MTKNSPLPLYQSYQFSEALFAFLLFVTEWRITVVFCNILNGKVAQEHNNKEPFMLQGRIFLLAWRTSTTGTGKWQICEKKETSIFKMLDTFKIVSV